MKNLHVDTGFNVLDDFNVVLGKIVPGSPYVGLELRLGLFFIFGALFLLYATLVLPFRLVAQSKIEYKNGNFKQAKKLLIWPKIFLGIVVARFVVRFIAITYFAISCSTQVC